MKWLHISKPVAMPGGSSDREKAIAMCRVLLKKLQSDKNLSVKLIRAERRQLLDDSKADLVEVDGVTRTVGGGEDIGTTYEIEVAIWK